MDMRRILLALCAIGALAAAGCGSSNKSSTSSGSSTPAASSSTAAASSSSSGGGVAIKMQNIAFDPKDVTVKVGQKVTWTNDDSVDHNVTSQSGESIKSDNFGKGATFSFTPTKAGTIKYVCTIHPGMTATLTVTK
ncbi:MAG TPA: plastocyanin/azurin family copper-binding protein [Solirubrobacteraceae bacterium]|nr:plastocyanin/azurin family copper-binding protein [Solirubrobacteraceae bacterium]